MTTSPFFRQDACDEPRSSVKLGSPSVWLAVLSLAAGACLATSGCIFVNDQSDGDQGVIDPGPQPPALDPNPVQVTIDPDKTVDSPPGQGVGLFVEYSSGGHWHVYATCDTLTDTNPSQTPCQFEGYVAATNASAAALSSATGESIEGHDFVQTLQDGTVHFSFETDSDTDGMTFDAPPGASVRLTMYLDGAVQPRFVYWFGKDVLHNGAPTDPVDFLPSSP